MGFVDSSISLSAKDTNPVYVLLNNYDGIIKSTMRGGTPGEDNQQILINKRHGGKEVCYVDWLNPDAKGEWMG